MRVEIHVRPGAARAAVGGSHDGALVVRVTEPADRGRATSAAIREVARALGLPQHAVRLSHGATSRRKLLDLDLSRLDVPQAEKAEEIERRLEHLRQGTAR